MTPEELKAMLQKAIQLIADGRQILEEFSERTGDETLEYLAEDVSDALLAIEQHTGDEYPFEDKS